MVCVKEIRVKISDEIHAALENLVKANGMTMQGFMERALPGLVALPQNVRMMLLGLIETDGMTEAVVAALLNQPTQPAAISSRAASGPPVQSPRTAVISGGSVDIPPKPESVAGHGRRRKSPARGLQKESHP